METQTVTVGGLNFAYRWDGPVGAPVAMMAHAMGTSLRIWDRQVWGQTAWTQGQAWQATIDMMLLARCSAFVGKFTSNFFRAAYALHAAQCDCAPPFVSLDAPWCFDYGLEEGRNWNYPLRTNTSALLERGNRLQC